MTDPEPQIDYIDYTSIAFPSDSLTIRDLRRAHPDRFDVEDGPSFFEGDAPDTAGDTVGMMLYCERVLARTAYDAGARGRDHLADKHIIDRAAFVEDLAKLYKQYGIASSGAISARHLIQGFEATAAQAAGRPAGRGPARPSP